SGPRWRSGRERPRRWFFFSSRRRHTRWPRDWSSDVCSSDLRDREAGKHDVRELARRRGDPAQHPIERPCAVRGEADGAGERLARSEEHTSELQSRGHLVCRLLLEKKKKKEQQKRRTKNSPSR